MGYNPGKELLNTLDLLGIDLGVCGPNVIEAWYDVDPQINQFLNWFRKNLNEENVLYEHEVAEYEGNFDKNHVRNTEEYQINLTQTSEKYQGIFDTVETEFEIECLEDELSILSEDRDKLDDILGLHINLHKRERASFAALKNENINALNDLEKTEEACLKMSCKLDKLNNELFISITRFSEKLQEYENPSTTTYISNLPINKYYNQYKNIISYFALLDKKELAALPKLQSAVKSCSKLDGSIFREKTDNNLNNLKKKLFRSIQSRNYTQAIKEQLLAELKFLEQFNIYGLSNSFDTKKRIEKNIESKSEQYSILSLELENLLVEISEKYIDHPYISIAKEEVQLLQGKLNNVKEVENVFINILSYHTLLYFMFTINNADMQRSGQFFRSIHHYIGYNLTKCESRLNSMTDIIKKYKVYENTPYYQRSVLLQVLYKVLSGNNINKFDKDMLNNFQQEINSSNIVEDVQFDQQIYLIKNNNKLVKSFLTMGPTSELISIPYTVYKICSEINDILTARNNLITATVSVWKDAVKQASETDWLKFKRQLWMYFLKQPQKVLTYIKKIEDEITRIRTEAV